eukprot:scaffold4488_cov358-Prasinococcus_capsulatus_cf.AAC.9
MNERADESSSSSFDDSSKHRCCGCGCGCCRLATAGEAIGGAPLRSPATRGRRGSRVRWHRGGCGESWPPPREGPAVHTDGWTDGRTGGRKHVVDTKGGGTSREDAHTALHLCGCARPAGQHPLPLSRLRLQSPSRSLHLVCVSLRLGSVSLRPFLAAW